MGITHCLPGIFSPFGVFLMRQGFDATADEMREAALILLGFADAWNMVKQPIVFLQETFRYPISVFLAQMDESRMHVLCTCGILVLLPVLLLFLFSEEDLTNAALRRQHIICLSHISFGGGS